MGLCGFPPADLCLTHFQAVTLNPCNPGLAAKVLITLLLGSSHGAGLVDSRRNKCVLSVHWQCYCSNICLCLLGEIFFKFLPPLFLDPQVPRIGYYRLLLSGHSQPFSAPAACDAFLRCRRCATARARKPGPRAWVPTALCLGEAHGPEQTSAAATATPATGHRGVAGLCTHGSSRLRVIQNALCSARCLESCCVLCKNFNRTVIL